MADANIPNKLSGDRIVTIRLLLLVIATFLVLATAPAALYAQDDPTDSAPPPVQLPSKDETKKLEAEENSKEFTQLSLDLMNARLTNAEGRNAQQDYEAMYTELGDFHGLVDRCLKSMVRFDSLSGLKKLEMALRSYQPRLETMRRAVPTRYERYFIHLLKYLQDAREKALAPMFSDSVVQKPLT